LVVEATLRLPEIVFTPSAAFGVLAEGQVVPIGLAGRETTEP